MLALPVFNDISIYTYQQEIFTTFMLADGVYIIRSLNWLKVEITDKIQILSSHKEKTTHKKSK